MKALAMGLPVVTMPSAHISGRFASIYYDKMDYREFIVASPAEYINKALLITHNSKYRLAAVAEILKRVHVLFNCSGVAASWMEFIADATGME
jgi:predicted O-linked N-acetylglucosamine transferase (SPINDLY family)